RSSSARAGQTRSRNAMVILNPDSWEPVEIYKMYERDALTRVPVESVGYEDIRIFVTDKGGLQGIAVALELSRGTASSQCRHPEQVLLSFDGNYDIREARPIRGSPWSDGPQKNWAPFDHCVEPRFLYSIGEGTLFDASGRIQGDALVLP